MSLIIRISQHHVSIPKLRIEFTPIISFDNLTQAALESFTLLRGSYSLQSDSSNSERREAMELLSDYGYELYQAIIPTSIRRTLAGEPDLRVYQLDRWSQHIPWELLHNGNSFLVLTNGVTLSSQVGSQAFIENIGRKQSSLRISLNSFPLISKISSSSKPLVQELPFPIFETLANGELFEYPNLDLFKNSSATRQSIIKELDSNPDILAISADSDKIGYCNTATDGDSTSNWLEEQFIPHLTRAVDSGLKIFILKISDFSKENLAISGSRVESYFKTGIPFIICCCGQLAPDRFLQYLEKLFKELLKGRSILVAHRQALNALSNNLVHSWDWSFIRLFVADITEYSDEDITFRGFSFHPFLKSDTVVRGKKIRNFYLYHPFAGSLKLLETICPQIQNQQDGEILYLEAQAGWLLEQYIFEVIRRDNSLQNLQIDILNYSAEDLVQKFDNSLLKFDLTDKFSFLFQYGLIEKLLDASLVNYQTPEKAKTKLLIVFSPPTTTNAPFDHWLQDKAKKGWRIIILGTNGLNTTLPFKKILLDSIEKEQLLNYIGDNPQINWAQELPQIRWENVKNFLLIRILKANDIKLLLNTIKQYSDKKELWKIAFTAVISQLSSAQQEIFWTIFLLKTRLSRKHIDNLITTTIAGKNVTFLIRSCLVETDVNGNYLWISPSLHDVVCEYEIYEPNYLERLSQHLLLREIKQANASHPDLQELSLGFFHCAEFVSRHFSTTVAIKRVLQFGKKLSMPYGWKLPYLSHCVRFVLNRLNDQEQGEYLFGFLFSCADLIENIKEPSCQSESITIYERLMFLADKVRDWQKVSELQLKLSSLYVKTGHTDKAIGLLAAALQLNNDLGNRSQKYSNLIKIALLLLDLGEVKKVGKLVEDAKFLPEALSRENMTLLWLIDGHLHYEAQRYEDAYYSFCKYQRLLSNSVPSSLVAKTYCYLAQLLKKRGKDETARDFLIEAVKLYNLSADFATAKKISKRLIENISRSNSIKKNIIQLEKLLRVIQSSKEMESGNNITNLLGGLYYKIGDDEKSTYYYKLTRKNMIPN